MADAGADIWKALQHLPASASGCDSIRSALLNLVGCHLAKKAKWHSSVEHFLASLEQDPSNLLALWNMAHCYDCLGMHDARFQALSLLFEASGKGNSDTCILPVMLSGPGARRCFLSKTSPAPCLSLAYHSARHLMAMGHHERAADCYGRLRDHWEDGSVAKEAHAFDDRLPVPDLPDMQLEHAHCLLKCGRFEDCVRLCGQFLSAASSMETPMDCSTTFAIDEEESVIGGFPTECSPSAGHSAKSQLRTISFYFYRGSALASLERYRDALEDIRRALRMTYALKHCGCRQSQPVASTQDTGSGESAETPAKKPKLDGDLDDIAKAGGCGHDSLEPKDLWDACDACCLKSRLMVNMGVIRIRQDLLRDAYNHLQAAIVIWPGNIDAAYNLSVLLIATGKLEAARVVWRRFKEGARLNGAGTLIHSSSVGASEEQYLDERLASNS
ncbi:unnamed protein product [Ixodes hexagonus]